MPRPIRVIALALDAPQERLVAQVAQVHRCSIDRFASSREELDQLLDGDDIEFVYVCRLSDLGESIAETRTLLDRLVNNQIAFTSVTDGVSTTEPGHESMLRTLLSATAEIEHKKLITNLRRQFALRGRGRRPTGGQRYGRRPFEDEVIAYMVRLHLDGLSHQAITDRLNAEGIPATKGSGLWYRGVVRRLLLRAMTPG